MKKALFILLILNSINLNAQNIDDCLCSSDRPSMEVGALTEQFQLFDKNYNTTNYRWIALYTFPEERCIPKDHNDIVWPKMKQAIINALHNDETYKQLLVSIDEEQKTVLRAIGLGTTGGLSPKGGLSKSTNAGVNVIYLNVNLEKFVTNYKKCSEITNSTDNNSNEEVVNTNISNNQSSVNNQSIQQKEYDKQQYENITELSETFVSGVQDGFFTGIHASYGMIGTEEYVPFLNSTLYEFGIDVGNGGIYVAFSPNEEEYLGPNLENQDESSLQFTIGFNYDLLDIGELLDSDAENWFITGMGIEWGTSSKDVYYNSNNDNIHESSDYTMFGVNFYTKIFKYVYFSYSLGTLKGDYIENLETTNINTGYNRTVIGLQIPF